MESEYLALENDSAAYCMALANLTSLSVSFSIYKMELPPTFRSSCEDQKQLLCVKLCTQLVVITMYYYCFQQWAWKVPLVLLWSVEHSVYKANIREKCAENILTETPLGRQSCPFQNICSAHFFPGSWGNSPPFPLLGVFSFGVVRWQLYYLPDVGTARTFSV